MKKLICILLVLCLSIPVIAQQNGLEIQSQPVLNYIENISDSVVDVHGWKDGSAVYKKYGAGVAIKDDTILTCEHVISDCVQQVVIVTDEKESATYLFAKKIRSDSRKDYAVLKVNDFKITPARIGNPDKLRRGDRIYTVGNPEGYSKTMSEGIFSGYKKINGQRYLQFTAPIYFGSSGGGLFNENGELVGIVARMAEKASSIGFAVPINEIPLE